VVGGVNDPQFAMLTLHLDLSAQEAKDLATKNEWEWPQATGVVQKEGGVPEEYQMGPATNFMIDPNGKVIAKVFRSEDVDTEIAKAFLERP
jgi:hypothetical protein